MVLRYFLIWGILAFQAAFAGGSLGVDLTILDSKTNPCDDFYQYSCGGWLKKTEIPNDKPMWNRSFSNIDLNNRKILNDILKNYASGKIKSENPYAKLLGDFYAACMDEKRIEKYSLSDFKVELKAIEDLQELKKLAPLLVQLHQEGVSAFFNFGQEQDAEDSSLVIGGADQGGLGLPDRDYYLDEKMAQTLKLYHEHVQKMFTLLESSTSKKVEPSQSKEFADTVVKIETALAKSSMSRVDRRDPSKVYHRYERKGLIERMPDFDWDTYLKNLNPSTTATLQAINVAVPDFFTGLNQILKNTPLSEIKAYLKWHTLASFVEALPRRFVEERFRFVSTALSGQKKMEVRWKRCVRFTDAELGFALSRSFVEKAYGKEGKIKSQEMVHEIEASFSHALDEITWMDEQTKKEARLKLSKINNKIGYPETWRSYEGLKVDRLSFFKTIQNAEHFGGKFELDKIGKPVNRKEWHMTPSTVNAYYDPQQNEMVFPAGILQYPFFDRKSPDSLNYGAIGMVMGHELTHGFDDQGRQYDANGNLKNWWDKKILEKFEEKTKCIEKQYSAFEVLPQVFINGKLTLGENIADQGGLKLAYEAWKLKQPKEKTELKDKKEAQKFFIAFAQSWCQKTQPQYSKMLATTDPHSPPRFRVNGVVSQLVEFRKVFECSKGSAMAPQDRCEVW